MWGLTLAFLSWIGLSPVTFLASTIGVTEAALNLLISILMSYPLALVYHSHIRKSEFKKWKQYYFIFTGVDLAFFNFGFSMLHNVVPILVMYLCTMLIGPGQVHATVTFVFNITYLLVGYISTESEDYDITWTMPHCLLALKMIALSFDLWDGHKVLTGNQASLSPNNLKTALTTTPSLVDLFGFTYFPSSFIVGPITTFRRYSEFVEDKYPFDAEEEVCKSMAITKLGQGVLYMFLHHVGGAYFPVKYMLSDEFWNHGLFYRHVYCGMWAHFTLYKYMGCWLLSEGSCIWFGLSYNGTDASGKHKWDGCINIKPYLFETANNFHQYIESFNCNTNYFAAEYIYKRLKFLGNRNLSQLFTLLFLALWHGIKSGYYVTFFNEFMIIYMEKSMIPILEKTQLYHQVWENSIGKTAMLIFLKFYTIVYMGWSLVPFDVKIMSKWITIYQSLFFSGYIIFVPWEFAWKPLLKMTIKNFKLKKVESIK